MYCVFAVHQIFVIQQYQYWYRPQKFQQQQKQSIVFFNCFTRYVLFSSFPGGFWPGNIHIINQIRIRTTLLRSLLMYPTHSQIHTQLRNVAGICSGWFTCCAASMLLSVSDLLIYGVMWSVYFCSMRTRGQSPTSCACVGFCWHRSWVTWSSSSTFTSAWLCLHWQERLTW